MCETLKTQAHKSQHGPYEWPTCLKIQASTYMIQYTAVVLLKESVQMSVSVWKLILDCVVKKVVKIRT